SAGVGEGSTISGGEDDREMNISGGKLVLVLLTLEARASSRLGEDQRGAAGAKSVTPWRRRSRWTALAGQRRIPRVKVSSSSPYLWQRLVGARPSDEEGWATR